MLRFIIVCSPSVNQFCKQIPSTGIRFLKMHLPRKYFYHRKYYLVLFTIFICFSLFLRLTKNKINPSNLRSKDNPVM